MWKQLYEVNKGAKLTEGATLVLPETLGKVARINAPAAASGETLYTVYEGQVIVLPAKEAQSNHITKAQKIPTSIFRGRHFFVCADLLNLMTLGLFSLIFLYFCAIRHSLPQNLRAFVEMPLRRIKPLYVQDSMLLYSRKCFLSSWFSPSTSSVISASSTVSGEMFTSVLPFRFTPRMLTP